ncbi:MAG: hypothetical protein ACD_78C00155G0002 [uncultured bacterium (gcode 4)]|uniref:Uncharacterized protein n=1 Tax=uncultured bacterium (gcode 4) TaxID=1234023 RepID=K1XYA3_9BACT|nr:MAG: hypothetical protein ACD_78C00155G0002 [uncultured bacterium (gcode 4)]
MTKSQEQLAFSLIRFTHQFFSEHKGLQHSFSSCLIFLWKPRHLQFRAPLPASTKKIKSPDFSGDSWFSLVGRAGLEPATLALKGPCSTYWATIPKIKIHYIYLELCGHCIKKPLFVQSFWNFCIFPYNPNQKNLEYEVKNSIFTFVFYLSTCNLYLCRLL